MTISVFRHMVTKTDPQSVVLMEEGKVGAFKATYRTGKAVLKLALPTTPKTSKKASHGLSARSIPQREVAFYELAKLLGMTQVVPETVLTKYKGVTASVQEYSHAMTLGSLDPRLCGPEKEDTREVALREVLRSKVTKTDLVKLTLLDFIACSRDRHLNNYGVTLDNRLVGWDNAASFGLGFQDYRSLVHQKVLRHSFDISRYWDRLVALSKGTFVPRLSSLIGREQAEHAWLRVQFLVSYPHRLPWDIFSSSSDDPLLRQYKDYFPNSSLKRVPSTVTLQQAQNSG